MIWWQIFLTCALFVGFAWCIAKIWGTSMTPPPRKYNQADLLAGGIVIAGGVGMMISGLGVIWSGWLWQ